MLKETLSHVDAELCANPPAAVGDTVSLSKDSPASTIGWSKAENSDSQKTSDREVGTTPFGDYQLLEEIARGGMGVVYKAHQANLNRTVAIKMILAGNLATNEEVQRFHAEAEAAARLDHPAIVPIYQVGLHEGQHFFSMGYVDGRSLSDRLREGTFAPRDAAELMVTITDAVAYAHEHAVIHRDLKPSNILIGQDGRPRVTDFGLAKQIESDSGMTATGQVMGTPSYMPPEQAGGRVQEIGPASDVYSLGAILYELLTGRPPFRAATAWETIKLVIEQEPVSPRQLNPTIDRDIETICTKCLQKKPSGRYATAAELADDLRRFLNREPIVARTIGPVGRTLRWCRRKPAVAALLVAVLLLLVVGGVSAVVARRASRARQLTDVTNRFEASLDSPTLTSDYIEKMELLINEIDKLAPVQAQESSDRLHRGFAGAITQQLRQPRLTESDESRILAALDLLKPRDAVAATALREELEARSSRWQPVFELKPPFEDLAGIFDPDRVVAKNGRLVRTTRSELKKRTVPPIVDELDQAERTKISCGQAAQIEAVFEASWRTASRVGLMLAASDGKGYEFLLQLPNASRQSLAGEIGADRDAMTSAADPEQPRIAIAEIRKDEVTIQRQEIQIDGISGDPLTFRASREDGKLSIQINQFEPLEFEDLFPHTATGWFAVDWPDDVELKELRAFRKSAAPTLSPLQHGDELYEAQLFAEALDDYREQTFREGKTPFRQEARFKMALCLLALNRNNEAESLLQELNAEAGDRWPGLAGCHLWLQLIREKRMDEADAMLDNIQARFSFGQLATLIPNQLRQEILRAYEPDSDYLSFMYRYDRDRLQKAERTAAIDRLLSVDGEGTYRQTELLKAYLFSGEQKKALHFAEQLVVHRPDLRPMLARILRHSGNPQRALEEINHWRETTDASNNVEEQYLLELCHAHAALADWDSVALDVDALLRHQGRESRIDWMLNAYLMRGFLEQRRGFHRQAQETWKEGYVRYRTVVSGEGNSGKLALILGSLTGELTEEEAVDLFSEFAGSSDNAILKLVRTVVPPQTIASTFREMWKSPRGKAFAEDFAFDRQSRLDNYRVPLMLAGEEFFRQNAFAGDLSASQQELLWNTIAGLFDAAVVSGKINPLQIAQLGATWKGRTDFLGWAGVWRSLDPAIRGPLAYIFAHRFLRLSQTKQAGDLFRAALEDAPADSALALLAQTDLEMLESGAGRLVLQSDLPESSKLIVLQNGSEIATIDVEGTEHVVETSLPAGQYQLRLADSREALSVTPHEINLTPAIRAKVKINWLWKPTAADKYIERITGLIPSPAQFPGIANWQVEARYPRGRISALAWSPDGKLLACGSFDRKVRVFDPNTGELLHLFASHTGPVMSVAWSPDSARLASSSTDATVRVWNLDGTSGLRLKGLAYGSTDWNSTAAWSPDGQLLAATTGTGVRVWNSEGALVAEQENQPFAYVTTMAWSPDGTQLATDGSDGKIRVLDTTGNVIRTLFSHADRAAFGVSQLSWSRDGKFLAYGSHDKTVRVVDMSNSDAEPEVRQQPGTVAAVSWAPLDNRLLVANRNGRISVYDADGNEQELAGGSGTSMTWSPDGGRFATATSNRIQIWNAGGDLQLTINEPTLHALAVAVHPDGKQFATADQHGLRLWEISGSSQRALPEYEAYVTDVAWNSRGTWLASASTDATVRLWKLDGTPGPVLKHTVAIKYVAWSPDDRLAAVGYDEKIYLWNIDGTAGLVLNTESKPIHSLAFNRDGVLAAGSDRLVHLWDETGQRLEPIAGDLHRVFAVDWSFDGQILASAAQDWLRLRKIDGTSVMSVNTGLGSMNFVAWSPDNQTLAIAGDARDTIDIRKPDGTLAMTLGGHTRSIYGAGWVPDSTKLLSIDNHATVRLWDTTSAEPIWVGILLPDGHAATFTAGGKLLYADPAAEEQLVYLIEADLGKFEMLKPSEFHRRIGQPVPAGLLLEVPSPSETRTMP